jgi:hypothetical protein
MFTQLENMFTQLPEIIKSGKNPYLTSILKNLTNTANYEIYATGCVN